MAKDKPESLSGMLTGYQVGIHNLRDSADYVAGVRDHWKEAIQEYHLEDRIDSLLSGRHSLGAHHVDGWTNPHGRFDEADNLHRDVGTAFESVKRRTTAIYTLLDRLQDTMHTVADRYEASDLNAAANQKKLTDLLDTAIPAPKVDR